MRLAFLKNKYFVLFLLCRLTLHLSCGVLVDGRLDIPE